MSGKQQRLVRIKICGITRLEDALAAVEFGADAIGFIFVPKSPRNITPEQAARISSALPPFVSRVGVFVDEPADVVRSVYGQVGLDVVQLHGSEPPQTIVEYPGRVVKAFRVKGQQSLLAMPKYAVAAYLLDTYKKGMAGGTGEVFDWELAVRAKQYGRIILAGGLNPDNIAEAIRCVQPYAVDISSGVEFEPGVKDHERMKLLVRRCRNV